MTSKGTENVASIKSKMFSGAAWMVLFRACNRFIGLVSTMILARILVPEDYGLVVMAMSAYVFLEIMAGFGFDVVLIQNENADDDDFDSAWTVRFICYTILSSILYLSSGVIADFYEEPQLVAIVQVIAGVMFIVGLENIAVVKFRKELQFKKEFYYQLFQKLAGFVVTVPLAFILENHWALVAGIVTTKTSSVIIGYILIPHKPRFTLCKAGYIFNFSKWLLIANFLRYFETKSPDLVLGKLLGTGAVGVYSHAAELAQTTNAEIVAPINRAIFPGYSKLKSNPEELAKNFIGIVGLLAVFILPIGIGISLTSEYIVRILLGPKWGDVVEPLSILAIGFSFLALMSNAQYIYYATGRPRIATFVLMFKVALLVPAIIYAAKTEGIIGVAMVYMCASIALPMVHMLITRYLLEIHLRQYLYALYRPILSVGAMYAAVYYLKPTISQVAFNLMPLELLLHALIGAFVYAASLLSLWKLAGSPHSAEEKAIGMFKEKVLKRK